MVYDESDGFGVGTMKLTTERCVPCRGGLPTLQDFEIDVFHKEVPHWEVIQVGDIKRLTREYKFKDFVQALTFANHVGEIAEQENHHPSILIEWGKVTITWWTHAIRGLHRNDFVMAAKTDEVYSDPFHR